MPTTTYLPPERPFLDPPHPSSLPSADKLGLKGANAWAYGISTRLMSDNGRWDLFNLVQGGMLWLDEYMLEIEERLHNGKHEEEMDFVELVKTPGRNKSAVKTRSEAAMNAEKLARINALHFGEFTFPSKPPVADKEKKTLFPQQTLPASTTAQTVRPKEINPFNPQEDLHVISHEPPTPKAFPTTVSHPPNNALSAAPTSATTSNNSGNERRFGPRPLPQVPNGMRSRTTSNASLMQGMMPAHPNLASAQSFTRPSSRMDVLPPPAAAPAAINAPVLSSGSAPPSERIIAPLPTKSQAQSRNKVQPQPAPRTPSPLHEVEVGMELDVPLNDTESGKERTSIFPTGLARKPSFSALPDPSPLRKSTRGGGGVERGKSIERGDRISVNATTPGATNAHSKERGSVRASSGWFKPKTALDRTPSSTTAVAIFNTNPASTGLTTAEKLALKSGSSLDTDEKTALNTAKNAAIGAVGGVKRKSDLVERSPVRAGPERAAKSQKKEDGTFAGDSAKRLHNPTTTTRMTPAAALTTSGQRSKTPVEAITPKESSTVEKSAPQSFAMDVEDDTMGVKTMKIKKGDGDDDTAERLLKLRKTLSKVVPPSADGEERSQQDDQHPRSRVDSDARPISRNDSPGPQSRNSGMIHRPSSRNTAVTDDQSSFKTASERPSHATSDRTRVDSGRLSVSHLVGALDLKEQEESKASKKMAEETRPNKKMTEETEPTKKSAEEKEKEKNIFKREEVGSGWGLPKWAPALPTGNTFGQAGGEKLNLMGRSTTPPDSPAPVRVQLAREESIKASREESGKTEKVVHVEKKASSIFKAPLPVGKNIFTAPSTTAQKTGTGPAPINAKEDKYRTHQESQSGISSQSTADEDPLFELKHGLMKKGSTSTLGTMSQPSQEPHTKKFAKDDTAFSWGEEGVTAGWMGGGNDTIGEKQQPQQRQERQQRDEEEEEIEMQDDEDEWDGDEEDVTNHRWAAIKAQADAEAAEDEDEEMVVDEDEEEVQEDQAVEMKPVVTSGGIFAQMGSLVSKTASSLTSLRRAAAVAEKEKLEKEKKDAQKREMEARRQAAIQKKTEDEKKRRVEAEKKRKMEEEKRKKEKADTTLNRSLRIAKPQVTSTEKKQPEIKRQPSKLALGNSTKIVPPSASKRAPTPTQAPTIKLVGASNANASSSSLLPVLNPASSSSALTSILGPTANKAGAKVTFKPHSMIPAKRVVAPPSNGNLMAGARGVEFKMQSTTTVDVRASEGGIDEDADLPDIKSAYSDSEDESRPRTYNPPGWAQSPDLRQALEDMRSVNPDTIFGAMPTLRMEEIFPGRKKNKFRTRTSSANWAGTDGVTAEEMEEYARRMGFDT